MVEVANHEFRETELQQHIQQHPRVKAAGDSDEIAQIARMSGQRPADRAHPGKGSAFIGSRHYLILVRVLSDRNADNAGNAGRTERRLVISPTNSRAWWKKQEC